MFYINVSFFNILSKFVQTFVPSVNKLLNARCRERCWLLSKPLTNNCWHLGIWCEFLPTQHFLHRPKKTISHWGQVRAVWMHLNRMALFSNLFIERPSYYRLIVDPAMATDSHGVLTPTDNPLPEPYSAGVVQSHPHTFLTYPNLLDPPMRGLLNIWRTLAELHECFTFLTWCHSQSVKHDWRLSLTAELHSDKQHQVWMLQCPDNIDYLWTSYMFGAANMLLKLLHEIWDNELW